MELKDLELGCLTDFRKSLKIANLSPMEVRLHVAAKFGRFEIMKEILSDDPKIDVNSKDTEGKTVLHNASSQGLLEDIQPLIDHGARIGKNFAF